MDKVFKVLKESGQMTLATSSNDKPRSSIMECIMVGNSLIFATDPTSIKGKNLAKNPKVSLTAGIPTKYVAIDGSVTDPSPKEIEEYGKILIARYPHFKELMASGAVKFKFFKVVFETAYYTENMGKTEIIKMK
jgi:uncharacterized pyridoxamine 5'-phosphate oxidase family protein